MNHNIMNIVDFVEKLEKEIDIPCYRYINIDYVDGKKIPLGEKNDMTIEQINKNRGKGDWISIYLKHIPNLYVIDFDEKEIVDCGLYDKLNDELEPVCEFEDVYFWGRCGYGYSLEDEYAIREIAKKLIDYVKEV